MTKKEDIYCPIKYKTLLFIINNFNRTKKMFNNNHMYIIKKFT